MKLFHTVASFRWRWRVLPLVLLLPFLVGFLLLHGQSSLNFFNSKEHLGEMGWEDVGSSATAMESGPKDRGGEKERAENGGGETNLRISLPDRVSLKAESRSGVTKRSRESLRPNRTTGAATVGQTGLERLGVDAIFVVGLKKCTSRRDLVLEMGERHGVRVNVFNATSYYEVDLNNPPIPIVDIPEGKDVTQGQVACFYSHVRLWRDIFRRKLEKVVVLEDDMWFTNSGLSRLREIVETADQRPGWHYIFLKRAILTFRGRKRTWSRSKSGEIVRARPSWGTAAYLISRKGAEFLLAHSTHYKHPLDVHISKLQENPAFVALAVCDEFSERFKKCPPVIREFTKEEKGECAFSGSQAGVRSNHDQFPRKPKLLHTPST